MNAMHFEGIDSTKIGECAEKQIYLSPIIKERNL